MSDPTPLTKEDQLGLSTLNRQELEDSLRAWIKSNGPGGWIDNLRCDLTRYENGRQVLTLLIDTQRDKIRELTAERDSLRTSIDQYYEHNGTVAKYQFEKVCAERDQYKQRLIEAQQFAVRQGNELRKLRQ